MRSIGRPVLGLQAVPAPQNRVLRKLRPQIPADGTSSLERSLSGRDRQQLLQHVVHECAAQRRLAGRIRQLVDIAELPTPRALPESRCARRTQAPRKLNLGRIVGSDAAGAGFHLHSVAHPVIGRVDGFLATSPAPPKPPRHDCRDQPSDGDCTAERCKQAAIDRLGLARQEVRCRRGRRIGIGVGDRSTWDGWGSWCLGGLSRGQVARKRGRAVDARPWSVRVVVGHSQTLQRRAIRAYRRPVRGEAVARAAREPNRMRMGNKSGKQQAARRGGSPIRARDQANRLCKSAHSSSKASTASGAPGRRPSARNGCDCPEASAMAALCGTGGNNSAPKRSASCWDQ